MLVLELLFASDGDNLCLVGFLPSCTAAYQQGAT